MSARAEFLAALRAGLRGVPADSIDEIIADYDTHFAEGQAANRREQDVAAALGNPWALAEDLKMELRISRWEAVPSLRSAVQMVVGAIALRTLNAALIVVVLPLMVVIALSVILASLAAAAGGIWLLFAGPSLGVPGGAAVSVLSAMGLIFAAVAIAACAALCGRLLANAFARWARARYQVLTGSRRPGAS